mmetsp:Transcript_15204/g.21991  ORF Transcript_15204/g.21991 Transcript_15204/m.21991 type:complete len:127 (+) Transcript_15204:411-791(+)
MLVALAFLTTRVSKPTHADASKLKRLLEYVNGTLDLTLTLQADSLQSMFTYINVAYGVHDDCKSHTGGCITFGTGSIVNKSTKHKLNTKSSTEAELVGTSDYLPNAIWVKYFMEAQGYPIESSLIN